jgi:hypothetical protein
MSVCTDIFYPVLLQPRRIRRPECSSYANLNRWVNFCYAMNLSGDPTDNDPLTGEGAWTIWDLAVSVAFQDVSDRGDDLLFVCSDNRVSILDWDRYRDETNWDTFDPIYRQLTIGPIPGSKAEEEDGTYALATLKRFRRFTFELATEPAHNPTVSEYKASVQETGALTRKAWGRRVTSRHGNAQIAKRGYSFLVRLEHEANEDFPLLWWQADFEELGDRRANDAIVRNP